MNFKIKGTKVIYEKNISDDKSQDGGGFWMRVIEVKRYRGQDQAVYYG
jgi:hypothetical protein